jgi:hypothetical protein
MVGSLVRTVPSAPCRRRDGLLITTTQGLKEEKYAMYREVEIKQGSWCITQSFLKDMNTDHPNKHFSVDMIIS